MKNGRILKAALLLALAVALPGLPFAAQAATTNTYYCDENGTRHDAAATVLDGTETALAAGVYVVQGATSFANAVQLTGDVTLILADGCDMRLEASDGLNDQSAGHSLTLYGQENQTGRISHNRQNGDCLFATGLTVNGGSVEAKDSYISGDHVRVNAGNVACARFTGQSACAIRGGTVVADMIASNGNGIANGSIEISGGHVKGLLKSTGGDVTVKGGDFEGAVAAGRFTMSGGAVTGDISAEQDLTISGGQLTAEVSGGAGLHAGGGTGTITLGLSGRDDFILASGYEAAAVIVADGKSLTDGANTYAGTLTDAQVKAIAGVKLVLPDAPPEAVQIVTPPEASAITLGQPLASSTLTGGAAKSGDTDVAGTFAWASPDTVPAFSDSQSTEYEVIFTPSDPNYNSATCKVKLTVNKPAPTVNPPFAIEGLTYTGQPQALLTAGSVEGGEMQYALGSESAATEAYTTNVPTATEVGTYYAWWRVAGDATHADIAPDVFKVAIAEAPPEPGPEPDMRIIPGNTRTIKVKEKLTLGVACKDPALSPKDAKWSTSDSSVATINRSTGVVTGKKAGTTTITATLGSLTASAEFTVVDPQVAAELRFSDDAPTAVCVKEKLKLKPYVIVAPNSASPTIKWQTSDKDIVKVTSNGVITGVKTGEAAITATQTMNHITRSASINITVLDSDALRFAEDTPTVLYSEQQLNLESCLIIDPRLANRQFKWKTSDVKIAKVNSTKGVVKADRKHTGRVTITATAKTSGISASIDLEVRSATADTPASVTIINPLGDAPLFVDEYVQLRAVVEPEGVSGKGWKWKSSQAKIAKVDLDTGCVRGMNDGTATIILTKNNRECASINIRVVDRSIPETMNFIDGTPTVLNIGQTVQYAPFLSITPDTAAEGLKWKSSASAVAKIDSATGYLTALKAGWTTLTATKTVGSSEKRTASISINVVDNTIPTDVWFADDTPVTAKKGISFNLTPYVVLSPETADTTLAWSTSDSRVAKVKSSGEVQCVGTGTAEITVTTKRGKLSRTIAITVVE